MRPLCLYVLGEPPPVIAGAFGDYVRWFDQLADQTGGVELTAVDGLAPSAEIGTPAWIRGWSGIVLTGSPASVAGAPPWREAWIETAAQVAVDAAAAGVPVLGICFGHQLVAAAVGAEVRFTGQWHLSTQTAELTEAGQIDPLFAGVEPRFAVQEVHQDAVIEGHPDVAVLARGARCVEAIAVGEAIRGVQFHPEFSADVVRAYVELYAGELGESEARRLAGAASRAPASPIIFGNFVREYAGRA